jgi:hypothetical protein
MLGFFFFFLGFSNVEEEGQPGHIARTNSAFVFFLLSLGNSEATTNNPFVAMPLNPNNIKRIGRTCFLLKCMWRPHYPRCVEEEAL